MIDHDAELLAIRHLFPLALGSAEVDVEEWLDRRLDRTHGQTVREYVEDPAHAVEIRQWLAAVAAGNAG